MAGCPDCSALRQELELMKREVSELQMENDRLHEHTASLNQQVLTLETMNSDLREQLTTPRKEPPDERIQTTQDDEAIQEVQRQLNASVERENALKEKLRLLEEANATLKESMTQPKIQNVQVIEQVKSDDKTQREELYNALRDNEQMREENNELRAAVEKLSKVALEVEAKLQVCEDEKSRLTEALDERATAIERLLHDAETFEAEKQTLEKKILEMDASEARVDSMIMEFKSKFDVERRSLQVQLEQYKTRLQELETKNNVPATMADQNELQQQEEALNDLTAKIAVLQDMRIQDKATIADLKRKLQQKDADLEQMADNFVPKDSWKQLDAAIRAETMKTEEALKEVGIWKARVAEQRQFIQELETRCANIEANLREAEALNAKYEAKAGLTEIMRHQKSLRNELQAQVAANSQLRVELSKHKDGISKLQAAFSRLKSEAGKPESFEYPDLILETSIQGNIAIIKELESQLRKLEEERVALLKKLKEQAKMSSAQLFQNHGLTPDQYEQVQALIHRLQHGDDVPKQLASSMPILQGKEPDLAKLQQTNEFLRSEVDRLTKALQAQPTSDTPPIWAQSVKDEMVKATESLQQHMREHIQVMQSTAKEEEDSFADDSSLHMEDLMAEGDMSAPPPMEKTLEVPEPRLMKNASVHTSGILSPIAPEPIISTDHIAMAVSKALEERFPDHGPKQPPPTSQPIIMDTKEEMEEQTQYLVELDLCLEELTNVTLENQGLRHKLQAMEGMLMSIQDQHTILYRNHITMEQSFATRRTSLEGQISSLTASMDEAKIKLNRYEMMLKSFESEGEIQQTVVKLTREIAIFEVNQARLAREFNLVKEEKLTEYNRRLAVEDDLMAMEKTLKLRIHYLETWRLGALDRIKQMEIALQKSTLKRFYDGAVTELQHLQAKFAGVMEKLNDRQLHYLATIELPSQHATLLHENALLLAQLQGQPVESVQNDRIQALEVQVKAQLDQIKQLETSLQSTVDQTPAPTLATEAVEVYEHRILELEQLCASLEREVQRHKEIAELAATQANTLAIRQTRKRDEIENLEERLHELSSRTDDDAIIATLQQKIISIKTNYQSFADRYEQAVEAQRASQLQVNTLSVQLEHTTQHYATQLETQRQKIAVLESSLNHLKQSDHVGKLKRFEAMNKRLEALDEELSNVYAKKRLLERQVEELQSQHDAILNPGIFNTPVDNHLVDRLKHRVQVLEEREKLLVNQVEEAAKISSSMLPTERLLQEKQTLQSQLDATLFEMDKLTHKIQLQLKEISDRDHRIRELTLQVENLTMELQQKQVETQAPVSAAALSSTPHSPSMKSKVGYYEKDHADLQQAAQATIASLKALVADKNQRVEELQNKLESVRKEQEKYRQQLHEDMDRQNRRLYEENHLNITKLKEAMEKIQHLEENGGGRAVVAAREMHEGLLEQLKQVHMELELKSQIITDLHHKVETLTNQRQVAEARAGEALEEIVALKQLHSTLTLEMQSLEKEKTHQMTHLRSELSSKEKKMALLRDAIIKLKEEFLKAQELQAEEIVRAASKRQHADDDRLAALQESNNKLQAKCSMLQEKVETQTSELASMANKVKRAQQLAQKQMSRPSDEIKQTIASLRDELSRYKAKLGAQTANDQALVELSSRIKVLEAQNAALRQATPSVPQPSNQTDDLESSRKHWELEKKLKRRIEILTTRLDEKKTEVDALTTQCQRLKEQYSKAQSQVQSQAEQLMQLRTAPLPHLPRSRDDQQELESCHKRIQELQEQVLQQYKRIQPQSDIEKELLEKDTLLLDLSFQVESLTLELQRVRRQSEAPTSRTPTKSFQKNTALEEVIENMKRAMEKLRNENERLRRNTKTMKAPKTVKVVEKDPAIEQQLERKSHECIQLSSELSEIQRKHRLLLHKYKQLKDNQSDAVVALRQEASEKEKRIEALERELSRKSPSTPATEEMLRKLEQHNAQLLEENAKLTEELSAFDLEFFEEIEDLKFKYAEAIRQKQWLERQLQRHH